MNENDSSLLRWQNITGPHRVTSLMRHPPIKPSSAPSLHRYTQTYCTSIILTPPLSLPHALSLSLLADEPLCDCVCWSLQDTLAYATALLNEKEQSGSSNGSDGSPANENADRSLRQVAPAATLLRTVVLWNDSWCYSLAFTAKRQKNGTKMDHLAGFCQML